MKQRDRITMTGAEVSALLAGSHKLQLATISRDGTPHLVTMFYLMLGGQVAFWTYRSSQKARDLARDPRVTCLVETGENYFELRGVHVAGRARCVEDPAGVLEIGRGMGRWNGRAPAARRPAQGSSVLAVVVAAGHVSGRVTERPGLHVVIHGHRAIGATGPGHTRRR